MADAICWWSRGRTTGSSAGARRLRDLTSNATVDVCYAVRERALLGDYLKPEFPGTKGGAAALARYRAVLLLDVPAAPLHVGGRQALKDYVAAGGGLIVAGGPFAFGKGGYGLTFLQEMLPVTDEGPWGLQPARRGGVVRLAEAEPLVAGLFGKGRTVAPWCHRFEAKPDATVMLWVGRSPGVVLGSYGKGRVAAIGVSALGEPRRGAQALLETRDWPSLLARLVGWVYP